MQIQVFTFNALSENTYILYDETKECVIIDPGCYSIQEQNTLKEFIDKNKLEVKHLLNTHCHLDHVMGNAFVKHTFGVGLKAHEAEKATLENSKIAAAHFGFTDFQESTIDQYIDENDTIELGNSRLSVRFTPGHAPGHIVFINSEDNFCINGDVLFRMSIGRTDLPGGNHEQLLQSIKSQLFTLPDDMQVYVGHGEPTTIGFEKKYNPFLQ